MQKDILITNKLIFNEWC